MDVIYYYIHINFSTIVTSGDDDILDMLLHALSFILPDECLFRNEKVYTLREHLMNLLNPTSLS